MAQRLADTRLVVTDRDSTGQETVEVVHEALIQGWGKLQAWLNEDRAFRIWQERLRVALRQWEANNWDKETLLRGALLAEAGAWAKTRADDLAPREHLFLDASVSVILWKLNLEDWSTRACRIANRNLTQAEWEEFIGPDLPYQRTCPNLPSGP